MITDLERVECLSSPRLTCPLAQALAAGGPPSVTTHYLLVTSTLEHPLVKTIVTLFQKVVSKYIFGFPIMVLKPIQITIN